MRRTLSLALVLTSLTVLAGCTGVISEPFEDEPICVGSECETQLCPSPPCDDIVDPCIGNPAECEPPGTQPVLPSESTRFARLTHLQWENSLRDVIGLPTPTGISGTFIGDPVTNGFSTNTEVMDVGSELQLDYERGAEHVAAMVVADPALVDAIAPRTGDAIADRDNFISTFGSRLFRRPMTTDQVARYALLFDDAETLMAGNDPFIDGVELTLRAMLQSPYFVYRVELSQDVVDGKVPLTGHEIATRLSYALWNTTPSDTLLASAAAGDLDTLEGLYDVVQGLLDDPRARVMSQSFHSELLHTTEYLDIEKNDMRFPEFTAETGAYMRTEVDMFIEDIIFDADGTYGQMLTSPETFVNDNLAQIYGLEGTFDSTFQKVSLDPTQRSGLLTRLGFLAKNATTTEHDPIHRGVFVSINIACVDLPPPPPGNIPPVPANLGDTVRERVDAHTGPGTCGDGCHSTMINPAGFAFENYDALGRYQMLDDGFPIDASASYALDGAEVPYEDAVEFSTVLANSVDIHRCYTGHWYEYMYGRRLTNRDSASIAGLATASRDGDASVRDLMTAMLLSDAFLTRTP